MKHQYVSECGDCQDNNNPCVHHRKERDGEMICQNCKYHRNKPSRCTYWPSPRSTGRKTSGLMCSGFNR